MGMRATVVGEPSVIPQDYLYGGRLETKSNSMLHSSRLGPMPLLRTGRPQGGLDTHSPICR